MSQHPANIDMNTLRPPFSHSAHSDMTAGISSCLNADSLSGLLGAHSFNPAATPVRQAPPALSPLDALALQGRLLQKKFEEPGAAGKRLSRLPPITLTDEIIKARPQYFRVMTTGSHDLPLPHIRAPLPHNKPITSSKIHPAPRPQSYYLQVEDALDTKSRSPPMPFDMLNTHNSTPQPSQIPAELKHRKDAWPVPRPDSPQSTHGFHIRQPAVSSFTSSPPVLPISNRPALSGYLSKSFPPPPNIQSVDSRSWMTSPSIRPVLSNTNKDLSHVSVSSSSLSSSNKLDLPCPPTSARSPSLRSGKHPTSNIPRPSFHYPRQTNRQGRLFAQSTVGADTSYRSVLVPKHSPVPLDTASGLHFNVNSPTQSFIDYPETPISIASDERFSPLETMSDCKSTSFVYKKYALDRRTRRESKRVSIGLQEFIQRQFTWDDDARSASTLDLTLTLPPVQLSPSSSASTNSLSRTSQSEIQPPLNLLHSPSKQTDRRRRKLMKMLPNTPTAASSKASISSISSPRGSTVDGSFSIELSSHARHEMCIPTTPSEHLERGIQLHMTGILPKSTYHIRIAAKAGHPTAMVIYALACQHGWGIKSNPIETIKWLRNAIREGQFKVFDDDIMINRDDEMDLSLIRAQQGRFAVAVHQLGTSLMNGWAMQQDKPLGLACLEIAGSWGDPDALREASLCYMDANGCKKDAKKAAMLKQLADARGNTPLTCHNWMSDPRYGQKNEDYNNDLYRLSLRSRGRSGSKSTTGSEHKHETSRARMFFGRKSIGTR